MKTSETRPRRICRTADDAFAAGWADAADDRPLTATEISRLAGLLRPYLAPKPDAHRKTA